MRLNAPFPGLEDNITLEINSLVMVDAVLAQCNLLSKFKPQPMVKVESDLDVDSRRSTLIGVVRVNASVAKFICVVSTCKSEHFLYPASGGHFGVSPEEYGRFGFD